MNDYTLPEAQPHGEIRELFDDVFIVTGRFRMRAPPLAFSRNMVIVRHDTELTLVNSMRLDAGGLARLAELGRISNVIRLAGFHGSDDPFYQRKFGATVYALKGQPYVRGFDLETARNRQYFSADVEIDEHSDLPVPGASVFVFSSAQPPEGLLLLEREGGILIAGDSMQNWGKTDRYFNVPGRILMRLMGFIKPHNIGPGWLSRAKPDRAEVKKILDLPFEHVLPVHGAEVIGDAKGAWRTVIDGL